MQHATRSRSARFRRGVNHQRSHGDDSSLFHQELFLDNSLDEIRDRVGGKNAEPMRTGNHSQRTIFERAMVQVQSNCEHFTK